MAIISDTIRIEIEATASKVDPSCVATRARIMGSTNGLDFSGAPSTMTHEFSVSRRMAMEAHAEALGKAHAKVASWDAANVARIVESADRKSATVWVEVTADDER